MAGVLLGQQPEEVGKVSPLVEGRVEEEYFLNTAVAGQPKPCPDQFRGKIILFVVTLGVVTEFALE